jgi:hypothetical protein
MADIMKKLHPSPAPDTVSLHTVFGLIAQSFQLRTPVSESPQLTAFEPFNSAKCGSWRTLGSVKSVIQTASETIQMESAGDSYVFSAVPAAAQKKGETVEALRATVVSVRKVLANSPTESVWELALEVNGQRRSATVSCYRAGVLGAQNTEIDGLYFLPTPPPLSPPSSPQSGWTAKSATSSPTAT